MELIYLYIEKFNDVIKKQEINFSPNFDVKIINNKLIIENKVSYMDKLYPTNIKNITMLLGKNGSGKTTILDILGMNRDDRCDESIKRKGRSRSEVIDSYFILYHIQGDYFGIEIMDDIESNDKITKLFRNNLMNFDFNKFTEAFYKIPIGLIIKKDNDSFHVVEHFFRQYPSLGYRITDKIGISYISNNYSDRINTRYNYIGKDEENYEKNDYLFKRRYYLKASIEMPHKFISNMKIKNNLNFHADLAAIEITPDFDYGLDYGSDYENEEIKKWVNTLEKILYIDKSDRINMLRATQHSEQNQEKESENIKEIFMLDTLSSYIIHQFIKGICGMIDDNSKRNNNNKKEVNINFSNNKHIEFLNNLKIDKFIQSNSEYLLGILSNKKIEYENLMKVIDYYKKDKILDVYTKLICISRYLYSRMESTIGLGSDSRYQIATEEFLEALNSLKEFYFHKKYISIKCNSEIDESLVKVFQIYDNYLNNEYSDITMRFKIKYLNLSEGEKKFLNLLSKIFDIVTRAKENQLSIILLDEPDQSLHPEWSRRFIKFLCDEIEQYKNRKIQIVLSTHSPFMTTDIMSEHIYCLEKINDTEDNYNTKKENSKINIVSMDKKSDRIHNTFARIFMKF